MRRNPLFFCCYYTTKRAGFQDLYVLLRGRMLSAAGMKDEVRDRVKDEGIDRKEPNDAGLRSAHEERMLAQWQACNARTARYGLTLSRSAMLEIAEKRERALSEHGRVELGESVLPALIEGFCDSPYLLQEDYAVTLLELLDAFYYFKNECGEQLTDDELIAAMRERYDAYDGSIDAVIGTSLEALCRARRLGQEDEEEDWEEEQEDDD